MNNNKIKQINNKIDAIIFLNQLINLTDKRMTKFVNSIKDAELSLQTLKKSNKQLLLTNDFDCYSERIESTTLYLLNVFGDETKTAVSYIQFRKILNKKVKQGHNEFLLDELDEDINRYLKEFRN